MPLSSPIIMVAVRIWSAMMRKERVYSSLSLYFLPLSSSIFAIMPLNRSVSYTVLAPSSTPMVRSRPMPVSTFFCSRGGKVPSACLLYCMNTSFQISRYLPQEHAGEHSGEQGGTSRIMNISVSGPQGPVVPAGPHQLCLALK